MKTIPWLLAAATAAFWGSAHADPPIDQAKCAAQASALYKLIETEQREGDIKWGMTNIHSTFASHLNLRLGRCFLKFEMSGTDTQHRAQAVIRLLDVLSREGGYVYDYAFWYEIGGKMYSCKLFPPEYKEQVTCASRKEFDAFIAQYMETTKN